MPRFYVHDTFAIDDNTTFVIAGFVLEGEVKAGMAVQIPFNATVKMSAEIYRIEVVRRPDGDVTCLWIKCSVADEVTLWETLRIKNRTIDIT